MNKFIDLVRINVMMTLSQMNFIRVSADKRQGRGYLWVVGAVFAGMMVYFGWINKMLYGVLAVHNMQWLILMLLFFVLTFMPFMTGLFTVGGVLFESRDLDQLFSYPISANKILFSKITALIIGNWPLNLLFTLPTIGVYCYNAHPSGMFYLCTVLGFIFVPLLPLTAVIILSYIIYFVSIGKRARNVINIILSIMTVGGSTFLIKFVSSHFNSVVAGSSSILKTIQDFYPPVGYLVSAINHNSITDLLVFLVVSIVPFVILAAVLSKWYKSMRSKSTVSKKMKSKGFVYKESSPFLNLLRKEFGRYFSSPIYVLNSGIGLVLITFFSISACYSGKQFKFVMKLFADYKTAGILLFFCFFAALVNTTASSISLEGKNLWILKSSPSDPGTILLSKLCIQLTVAVPLLIIDSVIVSLALHFSLLSFIWLCMIPVLMSIFSAFVGLIANLKYHRFDFYSDVQVVKNSASVIISMFGVWLLVGAFAGIYLLCRSMIPFDGYAAFVALILLLLTIAAGRYVFTKGKRQLELL